MVLMRLPAAAPGVGGAGALSAGLGLATPAAAAPLLTATPDDMTMGNARAPVTMIEYASVSCPHCADWNNSVFPAFKAKYIDTGKVFYVGREALTSDPAVAAAGFLTARCAGRAKYFRVLDRFFHAQAAMYKAEDAGPALEAAAKAGGLSEPQMEACLNDKAAEAALVARSDTYAARDHIENTPTFVIGHTTLDDDVTLGKLDVAIAAALRRHPRPGS